MSIRWERLAGNTAQFAVRVSFLSDPHEGHGIDPDTGASWGALQLWVGGVNLSAHVDGGQPVEASYWYLLPFMEWCTSNWNALLHEQRLPNPDSADAAEVRKPWLDLADTDGMAFSQLEDDWDWRSRHSLRFARDGGIMPGVFLRRLRGDIEVSWHDRPLYGAEEIKHVAPTGRDFVDVRLVASSLHQVLTEACAFLVEMRPESSRLNELSMNLARLDDPAADEVRTAWIAGLSLSSEDALIRWRKVRDLVAQRVGDVAKDMFLPPSGGSSLVLAGSPTAALLFSSVSPSVGENDLVALTRMALNRKSTTRDLLAEHTRKVPLTVTVAAWEHGYELAEEARDRFELDDGVVDMEAILQKYGVAVSELELEDSGIRGVSLTGDGRHACIGLNHSYPFAHHPEVRRFTLAHELCHVLFDEDYGVPVAVASGPWAPEGLEKRANAFAAMFLMPTQLVRSTESKLRASLEERDGVAAVAEALAVSRRALLEHGRNVGLIRPEAYNRLRREALTSDEAL